MNQHSYNPITSHQDPELFRESVLYTAGVTGFNASLVEKDYYCSVILSYLYHSEENHLIFKGGTCLSKIHGDFYRLSEDLDFTISTKPGSSRAVRSKSVTPEKVALEKISRDIPGLKLVNELTGHNESRQYIAAVSFNSAITDQSAIIKIEIGLRELLLVKPLVAPVRTLLINPFTRRSPIPEFRVVCLSREEAYAEKIRAALTRTPPAIRDYYDVYYAVQNLGLDMGERHLMELVMKKLHVFGNNPIDFSKSKREFLRDQQDTQLNSVLRRGDYETFDLDQAFGCIAGVGAKLLAMTKDII